MKAENGWHEVDLRDNRYNQIIHMVSAANGAEAFYTLHGHKTRHEGLDDARELDAITANAVCTRVGIDPGDRLAPNSIKRKFLVSSIADAEALKQQLSAMSAEIGQLRLTVAALSARLGERREPVSTPQADQEHLNKIEVLLV
nr:hypothetical protein BaRGS_006589 [Batillaria attramentaria]